MSARFSCGLVVGKFCPLHRGHELVIERALSACDEVIVLSYTKPEFVGMDRVTRNAWLRSRFPQATIYVLDDAAILDLCIARHIENVPSIPHNDAPDDAHRQFVGWLCCALLKKIPDAVFTSEDYGDGFAAVLTTYFQTHANRNCAVQHVCVDKARTHVPISGTAIRANPHQHRQFLAPKVYASFVARICLLGGESSGKTTLAQALAARLNTVWAAEYGRELWERKDGQLEFSDMALIGQAQVARENELSQRAAQWLVCDTSPLTTLFYSRELFCKAEPALEELAARKYDVVLLCAMDFPFVQDGTRRDAAFRARQHDWYVAELQQRQIPFTVVSGTVDARVNAALGVITKLSSRHSREDDESVVPGAIVIPA